MPAAENVQSVRGLYEAFNTHDFDRATTCVAPDVEVVAHSLGHTFRGIGEFRQFMAGWADAVPDGKIEVLNAFGSEAGAAMECRFRGINSGPIVGPAGTIPPSGRPVDLRFCEIYTIRDGQIIRMANYQDGADFMRQIGFMPEPQ